MDIPTLARHVADCIDAHALAGKTSALPVPNLALFRSVHPTELSADLYEPVVCLILQGRKETIFGETALQVGPGDALLVSHDVPVRARITDAPYLAIVVLLDLALLRSLYGEVRDTLGPRGSSNTAAVHKAEPRLIDTLARYIALADDPIEAKVMGPMILRELHFRLLMAPHGAMLRELLRHDSHASNIARAIARIRRDFRAPLVVPELASEVGMSASSFHKHFRIITTCTPLQYQKDLRLLEARRLLIGGQLAVSEVAYDVGYQSPNQFSREYRRKFGVSPRSDMARLEG